MLRFRRIRRRLSARLVAALALASLSAGVALFLGCHDGPLAPRAGPLAAVSDGANGANGNPDFFFLPPLVGNPSNHPDFTAGGFHPGLAPTIKVFELGVNPPAGCDITGSPVYGPVVATVYPAEEQYRHEWNTSVSNLRSGVHYRICVFSSAGGQALGFVDVTPLDRGARNLRTGEYVEFQDGRTLPIKFRIERGALCAQDEDCTEFRAGSAGGTFTLPSRHAAVVVPEGAIKTGDNLTMIVEQRLPQPDGKCLPTDLPQAKGCYGFRAEPEGYALQQPIVFEACVDVSALPAEQRDAVVLHSHDPVHGVVQLPAATPATINCADFSPLALAMPQTRFGRLLASAREWTARALGPRLLHATDVGVPLGAFFRDGVWYADGETLAGVVPAVRPPETEIVFHSDRDGNNEIYLIVPSTRAVTRLTNDAGSDVDAEFSPDGSRIAFASTRGTGGSIPDIWIMNADGSAPTAVLTGADYDGAPTWSPTGLRLAFARVVSATVSHIMIANADGSGVTNLTNHTSRNIRPAWSPDGNRIAFSSDRDGNQEIYVINVDGSGLTRLTTQSGDDAFPAWSPDGSRIAFASTRSGDFDIYVMQADGSGVTRLTTGSTIDGKPDWSPDGGWIAFERYADQVSPGEIYVVRTDGSNVTNLTTHAARDGAPHWRGNRTTPPPVVEIAIAEQIAVQDAVRVLPLVMITITETVTVMDAVRVANQ